MKNVVRIWQCHESLPDTFSWGKWRCLARERHNTFAANMSILLEMVFVTLVVVWLIRFLQSSPNTRMAWLAVPFVLVSAAAVPTLLRRKSLSEVGVGIDRPGLILWVLLKTCLAVFPVLFCGILLLKHYKVPLPVCPAVPEKGWLPWLVYQFVYVAVAEEAFFRGYLQSNILGLFMAATQKNVAFLTWMSIMVSASVFAIFHSVVWGNGVSIMTFFPGLLFGWLFVRTGSLLAPILFHGLANAGYGFIAAVLM